MGLESVTSAAGEPQDLVEENYEEEDEEALASDEEYYYEEEIVEEEYYEEEGDDEEEYYEVGDDEEEFIYVYDDEGEGDYKSANNGDDDDDDDDDESGEYMDDDSSAPPPSFDSDLPMYDDSMDVSSRNSIASTIPVELLHKLKKEKQFELQNMAVSEGARKAMEEALARERSLQRQAAKEVLQRKRMEQEALRQLVEDAKTFTETQEPTSIQQQLQFLSHQRQQGDTARMRLIEEIRKIDQAVARKQGQEPPQTRVPGAAELETRKRALAELRRQAAREQLAQSNSQLKAAKASKFDASFSSIRRTQSLQPSATGLPDAQTNLGCSAPEQLDVEQTLGDNFPSINISNHSEPMSPLCMSVSALDKPSGRRLELPGPLSGDDESMAAPEAPVLLSPFPGTRNYYRGDSKLPDLSDDQSDAGERHSMAMVPRTSPGERTPSSSKRNLVNWADRPATPNSPSKLFGKIGIPMSPDENDTSEPRRKRQTPIIPTSAQVDSDQVATTGTNGVRRRTLVRKKGNPVKVPSIFKNKADASKVAEQMTKPKPTNTSQIEKGGNSSKADSPGSKVPRSGPSKLIVKRKVIKKGSKVPSIFKTSKPANGTAPEVTDNKLENTASTKKRTIIVRKVIKKKTINNDAVDPSQETQEESKSSAPSKPIEPSSTPGEAPDLLRRRRATGRIPSIFIRTGKTAGGETVSSTNTKGTSTPEASGERNESLTKPRLRKVPSVSKRSKDDVLTSLSGLETPVPKPSLQKMADNDEATSPGTSMRSLRSIDKRPSMAKRIEEKSDSSSAVDITQKAPPGLRKIPSILKKKDEGAPVSPGTSARSSRSTPEFHKKPPFVKGTGEDTVSSSTNIGKPKPFVPGKGKIPSIFFKEEDKAPASPGTSTRSSRSTPGLRKKTSFVKRTEEEATVSPDVSTRSTRKLSSIAKKGGDDNSNREGRSVQGLRKLPSLMKKTDDSTDVQPPESAFPENATVLDPQSNAEVKKEVVTIAGGIEVMKFASPRTPPAIFRKKMGSAVMGDSSPSLVSPRQKAKSMGQMNVPSHMKRTDITRVSLETPKYYTLEDLREKRISDIDYSHREKYLSPDDFEKCFHVSKSHFAQLPKWQQNRKKRESGLF